MHSLLIENQTSNTTHPDAAATPPSAPRYQVAASLPPSTRMAQRNATLDAFIALLPSNHQEEDADDGAEAMHSLVVTGGDGRRHYGFLRRVSEAAAAGKGEEVRTCMQGLINKM